MNLEQARFNMIEQQIRTWQVLDQRVLDVLAAVPRDRFVPDNLRQLAYAELNLPIGSNQLMMFPAVEARMVQALQLRGEGEQVLEIGTGSGYVTALLARLSGRVYSVEIHPELSATAARRLQGEGIDNVVLRVGDGREGWAEHQPYDAIAVTGSLPAVPETLQRQLRIGGRLFVVIGQPPVMEAVLITRVGESGWSRESLFDTELAPLEGASKPPVFEF